MDLRKNYIINVYVLRKKNIMKRLVFALFSKRKINIKNAIYLIVKIDAAVVRQCTNVSDFFHPAADLLIFSIIILRFID